MRGFKDRDESPAMCYIFTDLYAVFLKAYYKLRCTANIILTGLVHNKEIEKSTNKNRKSSVFRQKTIKIYT